jgi:hypothetical protein
MNSLPLISHHLFVAAVGNEAPRQDKPMRNGRPFAGPARQVTEVPLELVDVREPVRDVAARALRERTEHART